MKRILSLLVAITTFLAFGFDNAIGASPIKAGASCSKLNAVVISSGVKFQCIKSGKKLVWDKGVLVTKPSTSPTGSPTSSTSATPSPSPTPTSKYVALHPVEGPFGITWENLVSKFNDISAAAWLDAQATIKRNQSLPGTGPKFYSYISPEALKVDPLIGDAETLLKRDFALFARFPSYPDVYFVALTTPERVATEKIFRN